MTSLCRSCCAAALPGRTTGLLCLFLWISGHLFGNYPQVFRWALAAPAKKPCRRPDKAKNRPGPLQGHHRAIRQPTASCSSAAGSALQKLLLAPQRGRQHPQHRPQNTGTAGHPPEAAAPQGLARGAWGSGCSSNVLSIHSGSSRAPCLVGISLFSLAESSSWLAGNPVPSTLAWPGTNR